MSLEFHRHQIKPLDRPHPREQDHPSLLRKNPPPPIPLPPRHRHCEIFITGCTLWAPAEEKLRSFPLARSSDRPLNETGVGVACCGVETRDFHSLPPPIVGGSVLIRADRHRRRRRGSTLPAFLEGRRRRPFAEVLVWGIMGSEGSDLQVDGYVPNATGF